MAGHTADERGGAGLLAECLGALPAEVIARIDELAGEWGVSNGALHLAAQAKVAAMVTGFDFAERVAAQRTWSDLARWAGTGSGQENVRQAWRAALGQQAVSRDRVAGYLVTALDLLAGEPYALHDSGRVLSPSDREYLLESLAGPERELPDRRFHELFEAGARRHPGAVAAVQENRTWTYDQLNCQANMIAWSLRGQGLDTEDVVAVVTERDLEWLAAVLAVFKVGGCYLPIEPRLPARRIAVMLAKSDARWVLAGPGVPHLADALAASPGIRSSLIRDILACGGPDHNLGVPVSASHRAYIYFTSGSTGDPKGAVCEHGGFLNHLLAKIEDLEMAPGTVVAQTAPQGFDISLWQLVAALLIGGRTHIFGQDMLLDVREFLNALAAGRVEVAQFVPSYLELILSAAAAHEVALPRLRYVCATGEALKKELAERWFAAFPDVRLVNAYGLTETSDDTNHEVMTRPPDWSSVPIGCPVRNVRVYVVDEAMALVPPGAPGEIVMSGVCVGRGYVNDPAQTSAAFGLDPYRPGERLYRSGDIGRWLPGGTLEYLGRRDSQVKIRGRRIEIGEIENRLLRVTGVRDGAVVVTGQAGEPYLAGFYTSETALTPEKALAELAATLPSYMVPQHLYHRAGLPLTENGKIDKKALSREAAEASRGTGHDMQAPATTTERRVVALWARELAIPVERIGRDSRFAALGGTSLSAIRLAITLGKAVTAEELQGAASVADLAALLDQRAVTLADEAAGHLPSAARKGPLDVSGS